MTGPLRFKVRELVCEVELMEKLAGGFLESDASQILGSIKEQLGVLFSTIQDVTVEVNADWPIRTKACDGDYERGRGGTRKDLFGELIFKWELRPVGTPAKRHTDMRQAELSGVASSVCRLKVEDSGQEVAIASWRMEFGDQISPGAFFHIQIPDTLGGSSQASSPTSMWPSWLPVPRIPVPPMTPMLALEFMLAEIFRGEWRQHLAGGKHEFEVDKWRALQQVRYVRYFEWQRRNSEVSGKGSPILATLDAKPEPEFFLI